MRSLKSLLLLALLLAPSAWAGQHSGAGGGSGSNTCPSRGSGTTPPATCNLCETFLDTDADTNGSQLICIGGNTWKDIDDDGGAGGTGDAFTNTASSVDGEIALFSGTAGKTIKRATSTGLLNAVSGVLGVETTSGTGNVCRVDTPIFTTKIRLPTNAAPSTTVVGDLAFDTNWLAASRGAIQGFDGTETVYVVATDANDPPADLEVPTYIAASGRTEWRPGTGSVEDNISVSGAPATDANFISSVGDGAIDPVLSTIPNPDTISFATANQSISPAKLKAADFGDFTCNGTSCSIDNDAVALGAKTTGGFMQQLTALPPLGCTGCTGENSTGLISLDAGAAYTWAGRHDFTSGRINVTNGSGPPPGNECDNSLEYGSLYVDDTSLTGFYYCIGAGWQTPPGGIGSGGDITAVGDFAGPGAAFQSVAANLVLAGPPSGGATVASMRALQDLDIPNNITADNYQPLDLDLSNIAALATTGYGRSLLTQADAATARTTLGVALGADVQPFDSDLTAVAAISTQAFGLSLLGTASNTSARALLLVPANVSSGTIPLTTSSVASGGCNTMTPVTAGGTVTTDVVYWSFNSDVTGVTGYTPATTGGLSIFMWPSANAINVKVCNPTGQPITPSTTVTLNWKVIR